MESLNCPKCNNKVPENSDICPSCGNQFVENKKNYEKIAYRIVGIVLILNGIFNLIEQIAFTSSTASTGNPLSGALGSIVIGIMVLRGSEKGIKWGRIAVVLGAIIFPIIYIVTNDIFSAVFQIVFSASLIILLFWNPGKIRVIISSTIIVLYFSMEIIGIYAEISGENYLSKTILDLQYDLEDISDHKIQGNLFNFSLHIPPESSNWQMLSEENINAEGSDADLWLMNTLLDAHIIVVAESLQIDLDSFTDIVSQMAKENTGGLNITDSLKITTMEGLSGNVFALQAKYEDELDIKYKYGVFANAGCAYQIICFSDVKNYPKLDLYFSNIITSFSLK